MLGYIVTSTWLNKTQKSNINRTMSLKVKHPMVLAVAFLVFLDSNLEGSQAVKEDEPSRLPVPSKADTTFLEHFLHNPWRHRRQIEGFQDVIYVIDSSSSVSRSEFKKGITTLQMLMRKASPDTRYAVVTIATRAHVVFNFTSMATASETLAKLQRSGGKTNTQEALELCIKVFHSKLAGAREGSFKRIFLVTDGQSNVRRENSVRNAFRLKLMGVEIFIVAVGDYTESFKELIQLASSTGAHLYHVTSMQGLLELVKLVPDERERTEWFEEIARIQEDISSIRVKN